MVSDSRRWIFDMFDYDLLESQRVQGVLRGKMFCGMFTHPMSMPNNLPTDLHIHIKFTGVVRTA